MERQPVSRPEMLIQDWFRTESLEMLATNLQNSPPYPGYPEQINRLYAEHEPILDPIVLPLGPWELSGGTVPTIGEREALHDKQLRLDLYGRPLHPWFDEMLTNPDIGVVTGKGFFWNWGPNYTADPIIVRYDLDEPHVLLITRKDNGRWALPGGFIDSTDTDAEEAARREGQEEALVDLNNPAINGTLVYTGVLADQRATANAWPETTAFRFDLPDELARDLPTNIYDAGDDADKALWVPRSKIDEYLLGSHRLIVKLAFP